jgi:hypothetical protein
MKILWKRMLFTLAIIYIATGSFSCRSEKCPVGLDQSSLVTGKPGLKRIYVPKYYIYRNGKYEFVKGHYRWVNPKMYVKRSLRGYGNDTESASIR